jgi:glycogen(starch) synthase
LIEAVAMTEPHDPEEARAFQRTPARAARPRRILMTTDAVGGVWHYALELCHGLARAGIEVVLAVLGPAPSPVQITAARAIRGLRLRAHPGRLEWMDDPWDDVDDAGRCLVRWAREDDVDLVHLNGYAHGAAGFSVPTVVVAHSCVLSWWQAVKGEAAPARYDHYRDRVALGLAAATAVVAPSRSMLSAAAQHYGQLWTGEVIFNGRTQGQGDARRVRATGGVAPARFPHVLTAGRLWDPAKNAAALGRIAPCLTWPVLAAGPTAPPAGDASADPDLRALVSLGSLSAEAMAAAYRRAAIYALPALYEPFGLSVLEAALGGCALVLGDIPTLRELWGDAAVFVDPRSDEALAAALQELIADPDRRAELSRRATLRARNYRADRMVNGYLDLYRRLRERAGKRGILACAS